MLHMKVTDINHEKQRALYIYLSYILLKKYGGHISHIAHTANML